MPKSSWWKWVLEHGCAVLPMVIVFILGTGVVGGIFHDKIPLFDWDPGFNKPPGDELGAIFDDLNPPYLCGGTEEDSCDKDPINLLFVNLGEQASTEEIAGAVRDELQRLDAQWGERAVASGMYFSMDGRRYLRQAELKEYQIGALPDAWHIRFRASPGCAVGTDDPCYVAAATHFDDFNPAICPLHADVGMYFISARQRVKATFAKEYSTENVRFPNKDVPVQRQCPQADDREIGTIAVVNMEETTEIEWPLDYVWILDLLPTITVPPEGSLVTVRGLPNYPIQVIENRRRRPLAEGVLASCGIDLTSVIQLPYGDFLVIPQGDELLTCPP